MKLSLRLAAIVSLGIFSATVPAGQWGQPPAGWDDFKFGMIDGGRPPFAGNFTAAIDAGIQIDYRYIYITTINDVSPRINPSGGFLLEPSWGWLVKTPAETRPSITIYFLQQGQDDPGGQSALNSAADAAYMKNYFDAVAEIADSGVGHKPIYVIEPDVWGYLLDRAGEMSAAKLSSVCHINDLGIPWLSDPVEFPNTIEYLPKAIIKTLKIRDPGCYAGILMANWTFPSGTQACIDDGTAAGTFVKNFLKEPYRGDFMGIEKNGTAAGVRLFGDAFYWDDARNADYLAWCKALGIEVDLPLFGWQISLGYVNEPGYDPLPNTANRWEDTYFPYFFSHVDDFLAAGFIGFDAGSNDRDVGTCATLAPGSGDNGWFYDHLKVFNQGRPYNLDIKASAINENISAHPASRSLLRSGIGGQSLQINLPAGCSSALLSITNTQGRAVRSELISATRSSLRLDELASGVYTAHIAAALFNETRSITISR